MLEISTNKKDKKEILQETTVKYERIDDKQMHARIEVKD